MGTEDMEAFEAIWTKVKNPEEEGPKTIIGTHSDSFHCDEVTACVMLLHLDAWKNSMIVRTRVESVFPKLDIVCDVGGVYDHENKRYDHHQNTFKETWNNEESDITKLSSAGLIFRHYGKEFIDSVCKNQWGVTLTEEQINSVFRKFYKKCILEIDCNDNGVDIAPKDQIKYRSESTLPSRVARFNPTWNSKKGVSQHAQFKKALAMVEEELMWVLRGIVLVHMPAYVVVKEAWDKRCEFHPSGDILYMSKWAPWKSYITDIEKEAEKKGQIKFMINQD